MKTRDEIMVDLERAGAAMAHYLGNYLEFGDLRHNWDRAFSGYQQINHLTGTPSYAQLAERVASLEASDCRRYCQREADEAAKGGALAAAQPVHAGDMDFEAARDAAWVQSSKGIAVGFAMPRSPKFDEWFGLGYQAALAQRKPAGSIDAITEWAETVKPKISQWCEGYDAARTWVKAQLDAHSGKVGAVADVDFEAFNVALVLECERAIKQRDEFNKTGISTASHGGSHDTCFPAIIHKYFGATPQPAAQVVAGGLTVDQINCVEYWFKEYARHHSVDAEDYAIIATLKGGAQ